MIKSIQNKDNEGTEQWLKKLKYHKMSGFARELQKGKEWNGKER